MKQLKTMGARPDMRWYSLRFEVLERDKFTCRYCGQYAPNVMLEVDHVIATCDGGTDDLENLVTACRACNRGKEGLRARRTGRKTTAGLAKPEPVAFAPTRWEILEKLLVVPMDVRSLSEATGVSHANVRVTLNHHADRFIQTVTGRGGAGVRGLWARRFDASVEGSSNEVTSERPGETVAEQTIQERTPYA